MFPLLQILIHVKHAFGLEAQGCAKIYYLSQTLVHPSASMLSPASPFIQLPELQNIHSTTAKLITSAQSSIVARCFEVSGPDCHCPSILGSIVRPVDSCRQHGKLAVCSSTTATNCHSRDLSNPGSEEQAGKGATAKMRRTRRYAC